MFWFLLKIIFLVQPYYNNITKINQIKTSSYTYTSYDLTLCCKIKKHIDFIGVFGTKTHKYRVLHVTFERTIFFYLFRVIFFLQKLFLCSPVTSNIIYRYSYLYKTNYFVPITSPKPAYNILITLSIII